MGVSAEVALLPTPQAHDHVGGKTPEQITAMRERTGAGVSNLNEVAAHTQQWGVYGRAIARWETLTRPAPPPTMIGRTGKPQLSPRFTEWMMGLPDGWVTDVPGITRNEALKALGNGVVPQQAAAAIAYLLSIEVAA